MKKLSLFILGCTLLPGMCFAACGDNNVSFSGFKTPSDDEFVYSLTSDFDNARTAYPATASFSFSGAVWECGSNQCAHHSGIIAPVGHAWNNNRNRGEVLYWCNNAFGDKWQEYDLSPCEDSFYDSLQNNPSLVNTNINMNGTTDKTVYRRDSNGGKTTVFCYTDPARVACVTATGTVWADNQCQCLDLNGKQREWNGSTCIETAPAAEPITTTPPTENTEKAGDASGAPQLSQPQPPTSLVQTQPTPIDGAPSAGLFECDPDTMQQLVQLQLEYASNSEILNRINIVIQYCSNPQRTESGFDALYVQLQQFIAQVNADAAAADAAAQLNARITASQSKIKNAFSELNEKFAGLKVSVWKNAEGNFNTSRLLSDSIAGVVLGTAGGLITSHVVKNGQIENGFEDIQCTVGGQVVANWNDQFRVGIQ